MLHVSELEATTNAAGTKFYSFGWNQVGMAQNVRFDCLNNGNYVGTDFFFCALIKLHSAGGWNGIPLYVKSVIRATLAIKGDAARSRISFLETQHHQRWAT